MEKPPVTICVLTYGDYPQLAKRCINSILEKCERHLYRLVVGANAPSQETTDYLNELHRNGSIDTLHISPQNLNKCPMMRTMFENIDTKYIWWFDDDSYISDHNALSERLRMAEEASPDCVMWGHQFFFSNETDFNLGKSAFDFVTSASWYKGLTPPSWAPGGKGVFDWNGEAAGDGRWFFITGGCWMIRTETIRELNWPDPRLIKESDDVFLGEATRQIGKYIQDIGNYGVEINTENRRGEMGEIITNGTATEITREVPQENIDGWFSDDEARAYQDMVSRISNGTVVEVGVWKGRSLSYILDICRKNKNRLVAVDAWENYDTSHYDEGKVTDILDIFKNNIEKLGHTQTVEILKSHSVPAASHFEDGSLDLVFIDADHTYEGVINDINAWLPKVKANGIICGHDYHDVHWGVIKAVDEHFGARTEFPGGSVWKVQLQGAHAQVKTEQPVQQTEQAQMQTGHSLQTGCIFIPTFRDTDLLEENYSGRSNPGGLPIYVYDDNYDAEESVRVQNLCLQNGWHYRSTGRHGHGEWAAEANDLSGYNRFIWESMTSLGELHEFVVKMDTDAYVIDPEFIHEFSNLLTGTTAIAGTYEHRPYNDVRGYWDLAQQAGYSCELQERVPHMQGGIYGMSKAALQKVRAMGFLEGQHLNFAEDCYMTYSCMALGVNMISTQQSGSWWRHYRPALEVIPYLKAIHPLRKSEWLAFKGELVAN